MGAEFTGGNNAQLATGALLGAALAARKSGSPQMQQMAPAPKPEVRPDQAAVMQDLAQQAIATGLGSTWLTGPQGVDPKTVKTTRKELNGS